MSERGPRGIGEVLQSRDLTRLSTEAATRRDLLARVRAALPEAEALHVVSASFDGDGRLVVGMDSAAWAARVRYSTATLFGHRLRVRVSAPAGASN